MTRILFTAMAVAIGVTRAFSAGPLYAGAAVTLNNYDVNHPIYYQSIGNAAAGSDFYVQILGGPDAASLQPIATLSLTQDIFTIGPDGLSAGFFDGGVGIVPGVTERTMGTFQVLAWKGAPAFDAASERVASSIFTQMTGSSDPPATPAPTMLEFPGNLVIPAIPEPAVVVLIVMGRVGLTRSRWERCLLKFQRKMVGASRESGFDVTLSG